MLARPTPDRVFNPDEARIRYKVLVQAGASGSGSMQIQVAKALGADVATTIRNADKMEFVRSLGADLVINTSLGNGIADAPR